MVMLFVLLMMATSTVSFAGTAYYVSPNGNDGGGCTQSAPCRTVRKGAPLLQPGDTLYLRGGIYTENINRDMTIPSGTSWDVPVTIAGYPGEVATFTTGGFNLYNMSIAYLIVDNIVLTNGASWSPLGPDLHHIRLQNSEVKNNPTASGVGGGYYAHHLEYVNLHIHHNGAPGDRLDHGMYICAKDTVIRDSDIHDNSGYGIQIFDSNNQHCGDGTKIYNNKVHHNNGDGAITLNYSDNLEVYNNLVYNNTNGGIQLAYGNLNNPQIYNNTIVGNGGAPLVLGTNCHGCENAVYSANVKNNILYGNKPDTVELQGGTSHVSFYGNLCSTMQYGCNLQGDPRFTNATAYDFTLTTGSAAIDKGEVIPLVRTDMRGLPRAQAKPYDLGAYSYATGTLPPIPPIPPIPPVATLVLDSCTIDSADTVTLTYTSGQKTKVRVATKGKGKR